MDKPWKVVCAFVAVFMAGAVFGGLFTLRASGRRLEKQALNRLPPPSPTETVVPAAAPPKGEVKAQLPPPPARSPIMPAIMRQFTQRLKLTPAQREKVKPIVGRAAEDLQRLRQASEHERQQNLADTARVTERMYEAVAALLSPEQREELGTMRGQMQDRVEKERRHRAAAVAAADAALKAEKASAETKPPAAIPVKMNYQYFSVSQSGGPWEAILRARNLAVYVPDDFRNPQMELIILLSQAV